MKYYVLFGPPGAGKGTQATAMVEKYNLHHISTGALLRKEIAAGSELGKLAKDLIEKGNLVPDHKMNHLIEHYLDTLPADCKGIIFDGFPRTIPQAEALKKMLDERGHKVAAMIELDVPEDELMTRLIKRGEQSGRADDNEETIKKRFDVYKNQTAPLIDWFENEGIRKTFCWANTPTKEGMLSSIFEYLDTLA